MNKKMSLSTFRLKNFKAVQDSKTIRFTPLTVFIGNNGSGKSSIVEALETLKTLVLQGLDEAMAPWHGFEYIWNQAKEHKPIVKEKRLTNTMAFMLNGRSGDERFRMNLEITADSLNYNKILISKYETSSSSDKLQEKTKYISGGNLRDPNLKDMVKDWLFLGLVPQSMTEPIPQKRTYGTISLDKSGSNIAEYLQSIRDKDIYAFNGLIEVLKIVLPFADDLQPAITSELDRKVYLTLSETNIMKKLPGWLLSTGTLRILALLSVLRHSEPPPVVIIEEIENGLDPRTIHLVVKEIQYFVQSGRGQIILTTHSPYLLDLLPLSSIIVVERDKSGAPQFNRPASQNDLKEWAGKFTPGKLYTMGNLTRR